MSAETLRRAAALMRERAEAATTATSWAHEDYPPEPDAWQVFAWTPGIGETVAVGAREADAVHIASWHPAVALAVADWLEVTASDVGTSSLAYHAALAVARAYFGESP